MTKNQNLYAEVISELYSLCIVILCELPEDSQTCNVISGFLAHFKNRYVIVTAGHCIDEHRDLLKSLASKNKPSPKYILCDSCLNDPLVNRSQPFVTDPERWISIDEEGYDFGFIPLSDFFVTSLLKAGKKFIGSQDIRNANNFNEFIMIGVTGESVKDLADGIGYNVTVLDVKRINKDECKVTKPTAELTFYGKLSQNQTAKSIKGMSGSPIFGVDLHSLTYSIIAIQSLQDQVDYRTICGTMLEPILICAEESIDIIESTDTK